MNLNPNLKERVLEQITPFASAEEINDHIEHTNESVESQREYLRRYLVEHSDDPLNEVDSIQVVNTLDEDSICQFIHGHLS